MLARKALAQSKASLSTSNKAPLLDPQVEPDQQAEASEQPPRSSAAIPRDFALVRTHADRRQMTHPSLPPPVHRSLSSPGKRLDPDVRVDMERRFRTSFEAIRVRDDALAAHAADSVDARAFTLGQNLVFNNGEYKPRGGAGRRLLAHELAHSMQQRGTAATGTAAVSRRGDASETGADLASAAALRGQPLPAIGRMPQMIARQPKGDPAPAASEEPEDKYRGTKVAHITISIARKRIGFQTPLGTIMGKVDTDLAAGEYTLQVDPTQQKWLIEGPNVKEGLRFSVELEGANPWTLSYPEKVPLTVAAGSASEPKTFGDMIDPATGKMKDPLWLQEGMPITKPIESEDDFESVNYDISYRSEKGNLSKILSVHYRDNSRKDINIDSIDQSKPKLWAAKQDALKIMDEYNLMFIMGTFPTVFFIITIQPLVAPAGGRVQYSTTRRTVPRGARGSRGGSSQSKAAPKDGAEPAGGGSKSTEEPMPGGGSKSTEEPVPGATKESAPTTKADSASKPAASEVPSNGPDLFKKTAQAPGGQAEKVKYFDDNLPGVTERTKWKAQKMGTASDGSVIYKGEAQQRALAIKKDGSVYTGTWGKDLKLSVKDKSVTMECDWSSPGWKQW